jgi:hypothetical protein
MIAKDQLLKQESVLSCDWLMPESRRRPQTPISEIPRFVPAVMELTE